MPAADIVAAAVVAAAADSEAPKRSEHPTFILDEAGFLDDFKNERAQEIRDLFDVGYKKGAKVPRCEEIDGVLTVKDYDVYCPKVAGKIGNFTGTMLSRGIDIHLDHETQPSAKLRPAH